MLAQVLRNCLLFAACAAIAAALVGLTHQAIAARIAEGEYRAAGRVFYEIIPRAQHDNDLLRDTLDLPAADAARLGIPGSGRIHVARRQGAPVAFVLATTAVGGYNGAIQLLVGVNLDGSIAGVRVLHHRETPGLGDKIEIGKSPWILGFDGKSLAGPVEDQWRVEADGGQFDQLAGATITPRAVVGQVRSVLAYLREQQATLVQRAQTGAVHP